MSRAYGEDRSNWQTVGPWTGLSFGIVKATEGLTYSDPTFDANWANLRAEKKVRGAYHFFHPAMPALQQAEFFVRTVSARGLEAGDMLISDSEITAGADGVMTLGPHAATRSALLDVGEGGIAVARPGAYPGELPGLAAGVLGNVNLAFLQEVRRLAPHSPVLVYTNLSVGSQLGSCTGFPLIIAWPAPEPPGSVSPWKSWKFWQYAFSGGYDNCDRDAYDGDEAQLAAWISSFRPQPPPDTVAVPDVLGQRTMYAMEILKAAGLDARLGGGFERDKENWVNSQTPGPGARVTKGSRVDLGSTQKEPGGSAPS